MNLKKIFDWENVCQLYWVITRSCNLNCPFCIREVSTAASAGSRQISSAEIEKLADDMKPLLTNAEMVISGGEPLTHPDFVKILRTMKSRFSKVMVVSNGTMTDFFLANIKEFEGVRVQISIDGTRRVHDRLRGAGTFEKAFKTVETLLARGVETSVATTVSLENIEDLPNLYEIIKKTQVKKWKISQEISGGDAFQRIHLHVPHPAWNEFVDGFKKLTAGWDGRLVIKKPFGFINKNIDVEGIPEEKLSLVSCRAGIDRLYIYPDLMLYGCPMLLKYPLFDLNKHEIGAFSAACRSNPVYNIDFKDNKGCSACRYLKICRGGCIGAAALSSGRLDAGDPGCPYIQNIAGDELYCDNKGCNL